MDQICNKCNTPKPLDEFTKCKPCSNGFRRTCKSCTRNYMVSYQESNLETMTEYHKAYRISNSEKNKEYLITYNAKLEVKKKKREYYDDNIEYYRDLEKTEERKKYRKRYNKNSIYCKWRSVLASSLKRLGKPKEAKSIDLLGYSALDLYYHMIPLFTDGMSWDNHGEWHIDYIKPVSSFDINTHPSIVNALSNLQPLWAVDNYKKYNNINLKYN